jgi:hypothetical protein
MSDPVIVNATNKLINTLAESNSALDAVPMVDPVESLKRNVFDFFTDRMRRIIRTENLREKIQDSLEADVDGGMLTFDERRTLLASLNSSQTAASESIISLFRPVPGAPSILADNISRGTEVEDSMEKMFKNATPETLRQMDILLRTLAAQDNNPSQ